jgi:hypothetical protein
MIFFGVVAFTVGVAVGCADAFNSAASLPEKMDEAARKARSRKNEEIVLVP